LRALVCISSKEFVDKQEINEIDLDAIDLRFKQIKKIKRKFNSQS